MGFVIFFGVATFICLVISGMTLQDKARVAGIVYACIGILLLLAFGQSIHKDFRDGSPVSEISPGVYKIGFVYVAGENVSLGVERPEGKKKERLCLYQFSQKDFEGEVKTSAKKLVATRVTTGEGTFNRYKLE